MRYKKDLDGVIYKYNGYKGDRSYRLRRIRDIKLNNKKVKVGV